mmetsp:Transcript_1819/g.1637  ORF Transcript_1819/g.1637 Transcript_1819/m.1637 type:complete len:224 (-) Transcript_1819:205-876(-)
MLIVITYFNNLYQNPSSAPNIRIIYPENSEDTLSNEAEDSIDMDIPKLDEINEEYLQSYEIEIPTNDSSDVNEINSDELMPVESNHIDEIIIEEQKSFIVSEISELDNQATIVPPINISNDSNNSEYECNIENIVTTSDLICESNIKTKSISRSFEIDSKKIGFLIGKKGKTIRRIEKVTESTIKIRNQRVIISSKSDDLLDKACDTVKSWINYTDIIQMIAN